MVLDLAIELMLSIQLQRSWRLSRAAAHVSPTARTEDSSIIGLVNTSDQYLKITEIT